MLTQDASVLDTAGRIIIALFFLWVAITNLSAARIKDHIDRLTLRERRWYRWAPLIAGISLLTLLGAGNAHVDVLGHALGFVFGVSGGSLYARSGQPRNRGWPLQIARGSGAALLIGLAWLLALGHAH